MTNPKSIRGSKSKEWSIVVVAVSPERYPQFRADPDHPFASMNAARRIAEIDEICAKLWLRCREAQGMSAEAKEDASRAA